MMVSCWWQHILQHIFTSSTSTTYFSIGIEKRSKLAESFDEFECVFLNIMAIGPRFSVNINFLRIQLFSKDLNVVLL